MFKVALLTEERYLNPSKSNWYVQNILNEDLLVSNALRLLNIQATRVAWDSPNCLKNFQYALFRTTWNYFDKINEFYSFLQLWKDKVSFINSYPQILWNLNKRYLIELEAKGINIPGTLLVEKGSSASLNKVCEEKKWTEIVIKPTVSAAAWETYRLKYPVGPKESELFEKLSAKHEMLIQSFQKKILSFGEISLMIINGEYSHGVLKKSRKGDFRVQDDFGGTVTNYEAGFSEIEFAKKVIQALNFLPTYARVDLIIDNSGLLALSELELIEPEMWFRKKTNSANLLAHAIKKKIFQAN
tara:strand:- start:1166 stop:2065 length:900 start_codon:yes stop_codon:yes gene_type:complete